MNKNTLLAVAFGLALALPAAAADKKAGPCADDIAKFCKDVKPGGGRVADCLKAHEKELSQACTDKRAKAAERRQARGEAFSRLGKRGHNRGGGTCMREYGQGFGAGFRSGFRMHGKMGRGGKAAKVAKAKKAGLGKVCRADIEKVCAGVKPGEGRVRDCLIKNLDKLSDGCKTKAEKMKVKLEEKGKKV